MSMKPGQMITFDGISITTLSGSTGRSRPTREIRTPSSRRSNLPSRLLDGSTIRPPLSRRFILTSVSLSTSGMSRLMGCVFEPRTASSRSVSNILSSCSSFFVVYRRSAQLSVLIQPRHALVHLFRSAGEQIQHRHSNCHTVGHLLENHRVGTVGDIGGDFNSTVHRTGMHDDDIRSGALDSLDGHTEHPKVFADRGKERTLHPLLLNAEHHDHVRILNCFVDRRGHSNPEALNAGRDHGWRTAQPDIRAELGQKQYVRTQHAAVQQVSDDNHLEPFDALLVLADCERIEQRLCRALVQATAGVSSPRLSEPRQQMTRP